MKKGIKKWISFCMVITTMLAHTANVWAVSTVESSNYPKKEKVTYHGKTTYGGTTVGNFSIGDAQAFCLEHSKTTPPTGTSVTSQISHDQNIQKVLYYGWKGPQQWSGFQNESHGIVVTSLALSYYYAQESSMPSKIKSFVNYISKKSVPNYSLKFSDSQVKAYKEGNIQRTKTITLESDSSKFGIQISLPQQVTYVDETHQKKQTGGKVTINGQTKFHFEASLNENLQPYHTGSLNGSYSYQAIVAKTTSSSLQDIGYGVYLKGNDQPISLSVEWLQSAKLVIQKTDIHHQLIDGAVFHLWNDDYDKQVSVDQGKITIDQLPSGTYFLQEVQAPQGFLLDDQIYTISLKAGDQTQKVIVNEEPQGQIQIQKNNTHGDGIAHVEFDIYSDGNIYSAGGTLLYQDHHLMGHVTTNEKGFATSPSLPLGKYKVVETKVPDGYLLDKSERKVSLTYANQTTELVFSLLTIENKEPLGKIEFQKDIDSSSTNQQIGEAFLSSIKYGLYAQEDIYNAAKTQCFYHKDELISQKETDKEGKIVWQDLPLGHYYLKELESNPSLVLNEKTIDVELNYQNMNTAVVVTSVKGTNRIASQRIQIFKEGSQQTGSGVVQGLKGAEFTFVLNSEYEKVGFDKAKHYFVGETDEKGYLTTPLLPYGTYRVRETKTPKGYYGASDFLIQIEKDSTLYEIGYRIQKVTVHNQPFESLLKIVKKDQESQQIVKIAGATFKIKNVDTGKYVSYTDWNKFPNIQVDEWSTNEEGYVILNTKLKAGHYQLEEIKAPHGYILNDQKVTFEISEDSYDIAEDHVTPITVVSLSDKPVKGKIVIEKVGEVLKDYQDGQFVYQSQGLAGSRFEIRAKKDIMDPSQQGKILYHQGDVVETLQTQDNGKVTSSLLPLGEYECQEISAPYGYVIDDEIKTITLSYQDQTTEIVSHQETVVNERQKVDLQIVKKDNETKKGIAGAKFALMANRDIYNHDGQVIVKQGTILKTAQSQQDGKVIWSIDLPLDLTDETLPKDSETHTDHTQVIGNRHALYVIKEVQPAKGYVSQNIHYYVDARYTHDRQKNITFAYDWYNQQTKTKIQKVDAQNSSPLAGATLEVIDASNNQVVERWLSQKEGHVIRGLSVGKTYILHEVQAPQGYTKTQDQEFVVLDTKDEQNVIFANKKAPTPKTDDTTLMYPYVMMGVMAFALTGILCWVKKKERKS